MPGKWSTETLADSVEAKTGFRLVIDMSQVWLDLDAKTLNYHHYNLCELDGLIVKKISEEYNPNTLDRLELLRVAESAGVRVFSSAESILRLIDRLSCTVTLRNHDIPMPPTRITECEDTAKNIVEEFGSAVFKPLYSTKARGMTIISSSDSENEISTSIVEFRKNNPCMYIQKKLDLSGTDLGMVYLGRSIVGCLCAECLKLILGIQPY